MNIDTFASLKELMDNLDCETDNNQPSLEELQNQCNEILNLIKELQFVNNSPHVQLATKQALQYINRALFEIELRRGEYYPVSDGTRGSIHDICGPAHASLEIILNLNYA